MATGTVKWFNATKGYGFIQPDDGSKDVFVHISDVERSGIGNLNEGDKLEFEMQRGNQGKVSAGNLKRLTLELGGKSPFVVDETADIGRAAEVLAWAKYFNNGQTCIAPDYVLVHESVKAPLLAGVRAAIDRMYGPDAPAARFAASGPVSFLFLALALPGRVVPERIDPRSLDVLEPVARERARPLLARAQAAMREGDGLGSVNRLAVIDARLAELAREREGELPSEGMVTGALQVPPSGRPTILLADGPVTGGYPVIAVATDASLDLLAQARPGTRIRFRHAPAR